MGGVSPVVPEVVLPTEGLAADVAGVGPLVRVCPLVDEEVVAFGEVSAAVLADELFLGSGCTTPAPHGSPVAQGRVLLLLMLLLLLLLLRQHGLVEGVQEQRVRVGEQRQ